MTLKEKNNNEMECSKYFNNDKNGAHSCCDCTVFDPNPKGNWNFCCTWDLYLGVPHRLFGWIYRKAITTSAMMLVLLGTSIACPTWLSMVIVLIVVLRDIILSGIRMVSANKKIVIAADMFGKVKSFFLDIASMILMLYIGLACCLKGGVDAKIGAMPIDYIRYAGLAIMVIGALFSLISLVNYSVNAVKAIKNQNQTQNV